MPITEEAAADPSAVTGENLAVVLSSNTGVLTTAPAGKKRNNVVTRVNVSAPKSKTIKSQAKSQHNHPPYGNMIKAALLAMQEKKGSSRAAILKYIMQNFAVGENPTMANNKWILGIQVNAHLRMGLKRGVASGILKQMKGTGASGSFRLADAKSEPPKKAKNSAIAKSTMAGDMKTLSPKKSMKKKSSAKKVTSPKKPKAVSKKASAASSGTLKSKKAVGRPKKVKTSPVKSKTMKKAGTQARSKKAAA